MTAYFKSDPKKGLWRTLPDGQVERIFIKKSMVTDSWAALVLVASAEQWEMMDNGALIQQALPHLTDGEREFIMTGITDEEWDAIFPEDDEAAEGAPDRQPGEEAF